MDDGKIIGLLYERNEKGLAEIQSKYGRELLALAERITGSREDAEEVVNDTLSAVWASIPPAFPDPLSSYVLRIGRNVACNRLRANAALKRKSDTVSYDDIAEELSDSLISSDESSFDEGLVGKLIGEFLSRERETDRIVFTRRYFFADSYKAIAKMTGLSTGLVSMKLTRMRRKLAKYLKENGVQV